MKLTKHVFVLALVTLAGSALVSCSNDLSDTNLNEPTLSTGLKLAKAPDVIAYTGDMILGTTATRSTKTRATAEVTSLECSTTLIDRAHEEEIINEWLPEKNGNMREELDTDFLFCADKDLSLEFYPVFSQTTTPNDLGVFYYDPEGKYHEVIVWENMNPYELTSSEWKWSEEKGSYEIVTSKGIQINVPQDCTFGFFWKGNLYGGTETTYYSDSSKNEETFCTDGGGNKLDPEQTSKIHAVTFVLDGKTYLGLEDWTDFDYQDWVFTCDQVLKTVDASEFVPGQNGDDDNNGDDDGDNNGDNKDEEATPGIGDFVKNLKDHVEANLAVENKEDGSLSSHLSIHVRTATDVEVFIPVPKDYYCDADDLEIVMKHEPNYMIHGGPYELEYQLNDSELTVKLIISFEDDGIRITTDGITQEVIDWCEEKCQDGITFEIWNYFNDTIDVETLKGYLNRATIKFLDGEPALYVNAFVDEENDCTVSIVDEQASDFEKGVEGPWYNGSDKNMLQENKNKKDNNQDNSGDPESGEEGASSEPQSPPVY